MKVNDDVLKRIAGALEQKYGVTPYIDVSGVIASNTKRIANALIEGLGITTKTMSNGTELNEIIQIAEAVETALNVKRLMSIGNVTDESLDRIAHALEEGYATVSIPYNLVPNVFNRIAIALERHYECSPRLDLFGCVKDGLHRIADVMESENFLNTYSPPVRLIADLGDEEYEVGDTIDFSNAQFSVLRANGKISPVGISEITFNPDDTYELPTMGRQMVSATYSEEPE